MGHLMPHYTGRAVLGGLSIQAFVSHGFAGIDDRKVLFGKPVGEWAVDGLSGLLDLYAVQYVVCQPGALNSLLLSRPDVFRLVRAVESQRIYAFEGFSGYAIGADVEVVADYNRIEVKRADAQAFVLKFHWDERMRAMMPGCELAPEPMKGVPVPFVRVRMGAEVKHKLGSKAEIRKVESRNLLLLGGILTTKGTETRSLQRWDD